MIPPVPQPIAILLILPIPLFPTLVGGSYARYFVPPKKKGIFFKIPKIIQHTKNVVYSINPLNQPFHLNFLYLL